MSLSIDKAIADRLIGIEVINNSLYPIARQAQLDIANVLPVDSRVNGGLGGPAVFNGNWVQFAVTPCITFRESGGIVDTRFGNDGGAVGDVFYDFETWDELEGGYIAKYLAERIELLLDNRRIDDEGNKIAPPLNVASGHVYYSRAFIPQQSQYENESHTHFSLIRYTFKERR